MNSLGVQKLTALFSVAVLMPTIALGVSETYEWATNLTIVYTVLVTIALLGVVLVPGSKRVHRTKGLLYLDISIGLFIALLAGIYGWIYLSVIKLLFVTSSAYYQTKVHKEEV